MKPERPRAGRDQSEFTVLVADDSALARMMVVRTLDRIDGVRVIDQAVDGDDAVAKTLSLKPDLLTLDLEMPGLSGLEVLRKLRGRRSPRVVMLSRFTTETADVTVEALAMGAFDAVAKPAGGSPEESRQELLRKLRDVIDAVRSGGGFDPAVPPSGGLEPTECDVIVVASSTGGPDALQTVLAGLPDSLTVPVVIVQHLPAGFIDSLARRLNNVCRLPVLVPKDGDSLTPGAVFLAPGGRHLGLAEGGVMYLLDSPPLHGCRPAADLLFQSAAEAFGRRTLGIVLTGMGRDGTEGAGAIRATGGRVIAQHSDGCTVYGMPKSVVAAGQADAVIPLPEIASTVAGAVR